MKIKPWVITLVVIVVGIGIFIWYRNRKKKQDQQKQFTPETAPEKANLQIGTVENSVLFPKDTRVKSAQAGAIVWQYPNTSKELTRLPAGNTSLGVSTGRRIFDGKFWFVQVKPYADWSFLPSLVYVGEGQFWKPG